MAKRSPNETTPSNTPMIVMVVGAILVVALVAWALTRSVKPEPSVMASDTSAAVATPSSTDTGTFTPPPPGSGSATTQEPEKAVVGRISAEDLKARVDRGEVTVIDVRDANSFAAAHIPGSLHIPFASVEASLSEIPRGKPVITYCT